VSALPFQPQGNTAAITVIATSSTAVQVPNAQGTTLGAGNFMLTNVGTQTAFVTVTPPIVAGATTTAGTATAAVIPVPGTPANAIPVAANTQVIRSFAPGSWFTTIAAATGSTLYVTPGDGI
jgi:hypothetical protein